MDTELEVLAAELGKEHGYAMPVARLLALGRPGDNVPDRWLTAEEVGLGPEHVPEIIRVMMDERWGELDSDMPEVYASIHAWRILADLRAEEAIPALIEFLARSDEEWDDWATEEIPDVLGILGPAAIPALTDYLQACSDDRESCSDVAHALQEIGARHPEVRDRTVEILTAKLQHYAEQDKYLNGSIIAYLIDLKAVESAPVMEAAFAAKAVEVWIVGDWEDVQIELGLRTKRSTPPWDPWQELREEVLAEILIETLTEELAEELAKHEPEPRVPMPRKASTAKKAKRKQADQARKKTRQRKKR